MAPAHSYLMRIVFPAPAGINRRRCTPAAHTFCVPRASGDKPVVLDGDGKGD
ncbi:hypothetical protein J3861_001611 [Salmonella enterica subsp. enterica serovar Gaminara]|nr:hypothetical protein [Salmonella enterica]EHG4396168.1 hypothetical protein [Salmonella enterica subsp. enterica serovar Gaminara]